MTSLQQMTFDRIGNLNEEMKKMLTPRWSANRDHVQIAISDYKSLQDLLYEQQSWIEALWDEERKDGCEELI